MSRLDELKKHTIIVADTSDFSLLKKYQPQDTTTNPSLVYAASTLPQYKPLFEEAIAYAKKHETTCILAQTELALDRVSVNFGLEILKIVPGRVSTEIDARYSFDTQRTVTKARKLIQMYRDAGIDTEKRILVKIASTWEGLEACRILERDRIHCNMTLVFSLAQAIVAAEAGATLISPFVGRISDFYKGKIKDDLPPSQDPGVVSVRNIYNYFKKHGYKTQVMGASFRNVDQVLELAGCDLLTVSPNLLEKLADSQGKVDLKLCPKKSVSLEIPKKDYTQHSFLWDLNEDEMAHFKLGEGIRKFTEDLRKLEANIKKQLTPAKL